MQSLDRLTNKNDTDCKLGERDEVGQLQGESDETVVMIKKTDETDTSFKFIEPSELAAIMLSSPRDSKLNSGGRPRS